MKTRWGEQLDKENVLPEYPRPQMVRADWTNLNGAWEYAITPRAQLDPPRAFDGEILVPFSPESELSGVKRTLLPNECLWYRRTIDAKRHLGKRTILHFGAVDQRAEVLVNGRRVCSHEGGYLPFETDITDALLDGDEGNTLIVRVCDETDTSYLSRGKQSSHPSGIWYTPQSGIWQTVWMETAPNAHIDSLKITPLYDEGAVEITVFASCGGEGAILLAGKSALFTANEPVRMDMTGFEPWSPENPKLYEFTVTLGRDRVDSYFAMRKFAVQRDEAGAPRLFLNNRPYFQTGVLDQGYWPDGLYTAPSDEAMIYDVTLMKELGFNMLRKHIKIEPLRWYYHCDRLGMLVWQDMVNGGGAYGRIAVSAPLIFGNSHSDGDYAYFAREDVRGREAYTREMEETVRLLYNAPCVAMWVPFNEGWGQFDANKAVERIRALDKTRTIDHASGWHDQGGGDVKSLHVYFKPYRFKADQRKRAVVLSEFGGYGCRVDGHCLSNEEYGYKRCDSPETLTSDFARLYEREILPAKARGLCATVYTQVSDVEQETNGFVTYDRAVVKMDASRVRALNERLRD